MQMHCQFRQDYQYPTDQSPNTQSRGQQKRGSHRRPNLEQSDSQSRCRAQRRAAHLANRSSGSKAKQTMMSASLDQITIGEQASSLQTTRTGAPDASVGHVSRRWSLRKNSLRQKSSKLYVSSRQQVFLRRRCVGVWSYLEALLGAFGTRTVEQNYFDSR
jgi:hypothetical protein